MAFTWRNNGSYRDLSSLAEDSLWPTSQAGGNMQSSARLAMTAPGSDPVDPLHDRAQQGDPTIPLGGRMPPGEDGKDQASGQATYRPARPGWGRTTVPDVVRHKPVNTPSAEVKP